MDIKNFLQSLLPVALTVLTAIGTAKPEWLWVGLAIAVVNGLINYVTTAQGKKQGEQ